MCDRLELDVWEIIEAAATKPFGLMKFTPGPGLGGRCIPVDPMHVSWWLKTLSCRARFIDLASEMRAARLPQFQTMDEIGGPAYDGAIRWAAAGGYADGRVHRSR